MLFKLSNLNSNLALTPGYVNPALNNSAQEVIELNFYCSATNVLLEFNFFSIMEKCF